MTRGRRFIVYGLLGLFLMATVALSGAWAQGKYSQNRHITKRQPSFQKKRPPRKNRFIRPSTRRDHPGKARYLHNKARKALKSGRIVSLSVIRGRIRKNFPGKIVDVQLMVPRKNNMPYIYIVKLLRKDGRLLLVRVNAANGRIISVRGNG